MGQSVSRRRESPSIPGSTSDLPAVMNSAGSDSEPHQNPPSNRARHISDGPGSTSSSVRRNLLNFVKPSNIRSRVNSIASTPGDLRKSWRNSRRLSRAPFEPIPTIDNSTQPSSSTSAVAGPSNVDKGKRPERGAPVDEDEDEYHEAVEDQPIHPSTPLPAAEIVSPVASSSAPISQHIGEHPEDVLDPISTSLQDPVLDTSEFIPSQAAMEPPPTPRPQPVPLPPRQFPPPGTLVIVQGVVHTTDISRTPPPHESSPALTSQEAQDDPHRSRTRDRLSALLRPSSTSSPSSAVLSEPPTVTVTPPEAGSSSTTTDESPSPSSQTAVATPSGDTQPQDTSTELQPSPQLSEPAPPERHPSISSSSIDVLGTLLSVAAAATAASLLTGSSEPILSSGLAPPQRHPNPPPPPPISIPPVPAYPPPPLPPRIAPDISATSRADRMRHAWSTIRERLGLRPSAPDAVTPTDENVPSAGTGRLDSVPTDARELMLAEMARAFNIGLGLNGLGGLSPSPGDEAGSAGGPADVGPSTGTGNNNSQATEGNSTLPPPAASETALPISMPPEGSFERFLVDLQLDLRLALTRPEGESAISADQVAPDTQAESQAERPSQSPTPLTSTSQSPSTSPPTPGASMQPGLSEMVGQTSPMSSDSHTSGMQEGRISNAPEMIGAESDTESIPHLMSITDSESEDTEDEDDGYDEDFHSANRESLHGEDHHHQGNGAIHSGMGRIDASGRINWWRLYRFPQITSITLDMAAAAGLRQAGSRGASNIDSDHREISPPTTTQSTQSLNHSSTSTSSTSHSPMPEGSTNEPSSLPSAHRNVGASENPVGLQTPPQTLPNSRSVVPVIIVGLQSVNPEWRDTATPSDNGDTNSGRQTGNNNNDNPDLPSLSGRGMGDDETTLESDTGVFGAGSSTGEPTRGRGRSRGWPSRAANAIRNLRPGRRNTDAGPTTSQASSPSNGSRTFLIYVIGGYYPPEHSIVTGGPNNFDSFEALLELADLLGQVKPSTVSKEEIEKSGLEVIKASLLSQYFREDKITATCLDRCLVCLEEYQPEEDVRLMRCRHAFHKGCVDEWMQKGRNNCPACRSTGVPTEPRDVPAQTA